MGEAERGDRAREERRGEAGVVSVVKDSEENAEASEEKGRGNVVVETARRGRVEGAGWAI